jgi:C1A family cysteine protease
VLIERHNGQHPPASYELGHNQFSDLTLDEYKAYNKLGEYSPGAFFLKSLRTGDVEGDEGSAADAAAAAASHDGNGLVGSDSTTTWSTETSRRHRRGLAADKDKDIPDSIDWVEKGAIPPIKNQGMCGSCWAFSAIGAIEGAHFVDTGLLVALSEQATRGLRSTRFGMFRWFDGQCILVR